MSTERNKATIQRMFAEGFGGNLAVMDEVFAPEYLGYNPPSEGGEPMHGPESQKMFVTTILTGFPGIHAHFDEVIAEGNKVAVRLTVNGVFSGALGNIQPTGKAFTHSYNVIFHFNDAGQIVEEWIEHDTVQFLQILGVMPQPTA